MSCWRGERVGVARNKEAGRVVLMLDVELFTGRQELVPAKFGAAQARMIDG